MNSGFPELMNGLPIPDQKKILRQDLRRKRGEVPASDKARMDTLSQENILESQIWQGTASVGVYASLPREPATDLLMRGAWNERKKLFLPKIINFEKKQMVFLPCDGFDELKEGVMGIPEPPGDCSAAGQPELLIVPGLAFDSHGYRVGYGGGFYDRFLAAHPGIATIGLCHSWQEMDSIPHDKLDVPVNGLATEKGLIWI